MYSIESYGAMIQDQVRMAPYVQALHRAVKPGAVVLDLGAGTGIFAMLACSMGAGKVYAIEPDDAIHVARQMAVANGLADRIHFIQGLSTEVTLPEKADVIVSDLRGVLPLYNHHLASLADARTRLLAEGGVLIPARDTLWAAIVSCPDQYRRFASPWDDCNHGLNMQAARHITINNFNYAKLSPDQMLSAPQRWAEIDYTTNERLDFSGELHWEIAQEGAAHGLLVWFDAMLFEEIGFSNAPGQTAEVYGSVLFPWERPIELAAGDEVTAGLNADLVGDDYVWRWRTRIRRGAESIAEFQQSTFFSAVHSPAQLRKQSGGFTPSRNEEGEIAHLVLSLMNGERAQDEIVRQLLEGFPRRFANSRDALTHVAALSVKFSR